MRLMTFSRMAVHAHAEALAGLCAGGTLALFSGPVPLSPDEVIDGQIEAVRFQLGSPAFCETDGEIMRGNPIAPAVVRRTTIVEFARLYSAAGEPVLDATFGTDARRAILLSPTVNFVAGTNVALDAFDVPLAGAWGRSFENLRISTSQPPQMASGEA